MKIMSFDVSSVSTGWVLFDNNRLTHYGVITRKTIREMSTLMKLVSFKMAVDMLLVNFRPNAVIIEDTYMRNVKTLKTLMQFIGVLQVACYELLEGLEPVLVSPNTVRSRFGVKTKEEAFELVTRRYKKTLKDLNFVDGNDITDACLQGLYYIEKMKEGTKNGKA